MANVGGGYEGVTRFSLVSKNKPKASVKALFSFLAKGPTYKRVLQLEMAKANNSHVAHIHDTLSGYCASTIAWHITNGRIGVMPKGNKSMMYLTEKGHAYARERGLV